MVKRPALTEDTFLRHLFSPKKNPLPTGLRARALAFTKGRTKARVSAYNRMSAASQHLLKQSGMRDAYLRGEVSLKDARGTLRQKAVSKGFAKPLRVKVTEPYKRTPLDIRIGAFVTQTLRDGGKAPNVGKVYERVAYLPDRVKERIQHWGIGQIKAYAGDSDNIIIIDGIEINPLWYN